MKTLRYYKDANQFRYRTLEVVEQAISENGELAMAAIVGKKASKKIEHSKAYAINNDRILIVK